MSRAHDRRGNTMFRFTLLMAVGSVCLAGCPTADPGNAPVTPPPMPSPLGRPLAEDAETIEVTAVEFAEDFEQGSDWAVSKYESSWIELTGVVVGFGIHEGQSYVLLLNSDAEDAHFELDVIPCYFEGDAPWSVTSPKSNITVRGRLAKGRGYFRSYVIEESEITANDGQPMEAKSAEELLNEFKSRSLVTNSKQGELPVLVRGTVAAIDNYVDLAAGGDETIRIEFHGAEGAGANEIQVGDEIEVIGRPLGLGNLTIRDAYRMGDE